MKIAISILNATNKLEELENLNPDYLHIDMMDGNFVNNKSFEINEIKEILKNTKTKLDIHLMVNNIEKYVEELSTLNPEFLTFHYEATNNIIEVINYIKKFGIKVGMSIKPDTNVEGIIGFLPLLDLILVMSVEPGLGGQKYLDSATDKINELKNLKKDMNYVIEVDGGINPKTLGNISNADIAVVGSFITKENIEENYKKIKEVI